ncbi:hypothetical protein VTI74DRAFT_3734 [Chaetomium olivicolor]
MLRFRCRLQTRVEFRFKLTLISERDGCRFDEKSNQPIPALQCFYSITTLSTVSQSSTVDTDRLQVLVPNFIRTPCVLCSSSSRTQTSSYLGTRRSVLSQWEAGTGETTHICPLCLELSQRRQDPKPSISLVCTTQAQVIRLCLYLTGVLRISSCHHSLYWVLKRGRDITHTS